MSGAGHYDAVRQGDSFFSGVSTGYRVQGLACAAASCGVGVVAHGV